MCGQISQFATHKYIYLYIYTCTYTYTYTYPLIIATCKKKHKADVRSHTIFAKLGITLISKGNVIHQEIADEIFEV